MSHTPTVSTILSPEAGATPESYFRESSSSRFNVGSLSLDGSGGRGATVYLPPEASDAVAYLDALIRAACDLRNHYVEWAKTHEVALAA
jgi:hypothetical protein